MAAITISQMPKPEASGDWHDKPLKWLVEGPGEERQKFSTKAWATLYKRCRKASSDANEATRNFCNLA